MTTPKVVVQEALLDGSIKTEVYEWTERYPERGDLARITWEHNVLQNQILSKETDRAVAVLAPAYLDNILDDLLRTVFKVGKSTENLLSEDKAPLGTFSSRIDCAHALGLIADDVWNDLHLVRKIRNDFAHTVDAHSFAFDPAFNRCKEFRLSDRWEKEGPLADAKDARDRFLFAVWAAMFDIAKAIDTAKKSANKAPQT